MKKRSYKILGVRVDNVSLDEALEYIKKFKVQSSKFKVGKRKIFHIVTVNPEFVILARENLAFRKIINRACLSVADGVGILWAGVLRGQRFREKITGGQLMRRLCQWAGEEGLTIGLIGGGPGVALKALECLRRRYPGLKGWAQQGPWMNSQFSIPNSQFSNFRIKDSRVKKTDILFVAMGAPKQEFFIESLSKGLSLGGIIPCRDNPLIAMGVGGAFDELAGRVRPAPVWLEKIGFKWLWRLFWEPWRWRRQLRLVKFVYLVLWEGFVSRLTD